MKVSRMPSRKVFKGCWKKKREGAVEEDDIKKEKERWRAVGCGGWRNSVSHEIELAVCNTFGFEEDALQPVISSCTPPATETGKKKVPARASARGIFTINHGDEF